MKTLEKAVEELSSVIQKLKETIDSHKTESTRQGERIVHVESKTDNSDRPRDD